MALSMAANESMRDMDMQLALLSHPGCRRGLPLQSCLCRSANVDQTCHV